MLRNALHDYSKPLPSDDFLDKASLHCVMIEGSKELSPYPSSCRLRIELRAVPSQDVELTTREIEGSLTKIVEKQPQFRFRCPRVLFSRSAYWLDAL